MLVTVEVVKDNLTSVKWRRRFRVFKLPATIDKRGPVFLAVTTPLTLVVTIIVSLLIGEAVTRRSVISGALMVGGLYNVLWGKRIEQGGSKENTTSFDLEERERGAPVPAMLDSIKPVPDAREKTDLPR